MHFPIVPHHSKSECYKRAEMHLEASRVSGLDEIVGKGKYRVFIIFCDV